MFEEINMPVTTSISLVSLLFCCAALIYVRKLVDSKKNITDKPDDPDAKSLMKNIVCDNCFDGMWLTPEQKEVVSAFNSLIDDMESKRIEIIRYEEDLRRSKKLFENASDAILVTDAAQNILAVNPAFERMSGYRLSELEGRSPGHFSSGERSVDFYCGMWDSLRSDGRWSGLVINKRRDGTIYEQNVTINAIENAFGQPVYYISTYSDVQSRLLTDERIRFLSYHDILTGLPNKTFMQDRLGYALSFARSRRTTFSVMFVDLDRFELTNKTIGRVAGDKLLQMVARRIKSAVSDQCTVARIGGDEFVVIAPDADEQSAISIAKGIIQSIMMNYDIDGKVIKSRASVGIATYPAHGYDANSILKNADIAMYHAKKDGRNNYKVFSDDLRVDGKSSSLFSIEKEIAFALEKNQFALFFQPQMTLGTNRLCGAEALIRWRHPIYGMISPVDFIPVAESSGQIMSIGGWVLREACRAASEWARMGYFVPVGINVSMIQMMSDGFAKSVARAISDFKLKPELIDIEITERIMMEDPENAVKVMNELREIGVSISIDDFGTGYSSLSYIKTMPITQIKIDKSFVDDIENGSNAVVESIIAMSKKIGIDTIAEGTESQDQMDKLHSMGCDKIQGYHYSRPLSQDDLIEFYKNHE